MLRFDHHLSVRLVAQLADLFPDARHVTHLGLERATDEQIWPYAATHGCTIVTKDSDFSDLSVLRGAPPQVIWLRLGTARRPRLKPSCGGMATPFARFSRPRALGPWSCARPIMSAG